MKSVLRSGYSPGQELEKREPLSRPEQICRPRTVLAKGGLTKMGNTGSFIFPGIGNVIRTEKPNTSSQKIVFPIENYYHINKSSIGWTGKPKREVLNAEKKKAIYETGRGPEMERDETEKSSMRIGGRFVCRRRGAYLRGETRKIRFAEK